MELLLVSERVGFAFFFSKGYVFEKGVQLTLFDGDYWDGLGRHTHTQTRHAEPEVLPWNQTIRTIIVTGSHERKDLS